MKKYIYHEQIHAKRYKSLIIFPKKPFEVCERYCNGLSREQFYMAYNELLHIFQNIYEDMELAPEECGLFLFRIQEFSHTSSQGRRSRIHFYPLFFFVAFSSGWLSGNNILHIDADKFRINIKKYKLTRVNEIIKVFSKYGFYFANDNNNILLEYKKNPHVLNVLAAATDKAEKMGEVLSNTKYMCLYYKLFANCSSDCEEYDLDDYCEALPEYAEAIQKLNKELLQLGFFSVANGFYRLYYRHSKKKYSDIVYLSYTENCEVYIRLKLRNIRLYNDKVECLPSHIKEVLLKYLCCYCNTSCSKNNIKFSMNGIAVEACVYNSFVFLQPTVEDIKYIINLITWEMET